LETDRYHFFGPFCLDTVNRSLLRDGKAVSIQPKAYEVLLMLVQNSGRTVSRDELMNAIWGLHVSEGVLSFQINQLRKALNDTVSNPQYIQTIPKHGFRFITTVTFSSNGYAGPERNQESLAPAVGEAGGQNGKQKSVGYEQYVELPTPLQDSNGNIIRAAQVVRDTSLSVDQVEETKAFGGHLLHVITCCSIYAGLYAVGLVAEIAYEFDKYGKAAVLAALAVYAWIFISSLTGFNVAYKLTRKGSSVGLFVSLLIFFLAAILLFAGACWFLPSVPITQARFQTYTAEAAYLKSILYFLLLVPFYMLVPFHFVIAMQKQMERDGRPQVLKTLTGSHPIVYPKGSFYLRPWLLLLMLSIIIATTFFLHSNLFDNLSLSTYTNLFSVLMHVRLILYFALGLTCLAWYYQALNDIKLKCLEGNPVAEPSQSNRI